MKIEIPDSLATSAGLDERQALLEFALSLYAQERLSGGQARALCNLGYFEFEQIVTQRGLPTGFITDEDGEHELETIRKLAGQ